MSAYFRLFLLQTPSPSILLDRQALFFTLKIRHTFSAKERLKSRKQTETLFKKGEVLFKYPLRISYVCREESLSQLPQVLFSVPKKNFKKAVDRNLIRRRLKESYRLQKHLLLTEKGCRLESMAFVYVAKESLSFVDLKKKMLTCLKQLEII